MNRNKRIFIIAILAVSSMLFDKTFQPIVLGQSDAHLYAYNALEFEGTSSAAGIGSLPESKLDVDPLVISWKLLMDIDYELKYYKEIGTEMYAPIFTEAVKALDGKEITIKGYIIPIDEKVGLFALSANPYASCFFCGQASPASVISIHLKDRTQRFKLDQIKNFRGNIKLNYNDPNEFYYILKNAR